MTSQRSPGRVDAEHVEVAAEAGQHRDRQHGEAGQVSSSEAAEPAAGRVEPAVAGHRPRDVDRVLRGLAEADDAVQRGQRTDDDARTRCPGGPRGGRAGRRRSGTGSAPR